MGKCRLLKVGIDRLTILRFRPQSYSEILEAEVPFLQNNDLFSGYVGWNLTEPWPSDNLFGVTPPSEGSRIDPDLTTQDPFSPRSTAANPQSVVGEEQDAHPIADCLPHLSG